jgi:hypothetical protein
LLEEVAVLRQEPEAEALLDRPDLLDAEPGAEDHVGRAQQFDGLLGGARHSRHSAGRAHTLCRWNATVGTHRAVPTEPDLLRALSDAGAPVASVWDWVHTATPAAAIPVLIHWLGRIDPDEARLREGMVRALTCPAARPAAASTIATEMRRQAQHGSGWMTLWAYGNALAVVADDSTFDEVAELASDASLGRAREMLPAALARMGTPGATDALVRLLNDPDVGGHAVVALARRRGVPPEVFEPFLDDRRAWVRTAARRGRAGR